MMFYENSYWGMGFIWWFFWIIIVLWIFAVPYDIPGQRKKKDGPLDILQKRFASGEITQQKYEEKKNILKSN